MDVFDAKKILRVQRLALFWGLLSIVGTCSAQSIRLVWDKNPEPDVVGYYVYVATSSYIYLQPPFDVGRNTTCSFTNLAPATYFFVVTARNSSGLESDFSNEVSATISGEGRAVVLSFSGDNILGQGEPGGLYFIEISGDLQTWSLGGVAPSGPDGQFVLYQAQHQDPPSLFYRARAWLFPLP